MGQCSTNPSNCVFTGELLPLLTFLSRIAQKFCLRKSLVLASTPSSGVRFFAGNLLLNVYDEVSFLMGLLLTRFNVLPFVCFSETKASGLMYIVLPHFFFSLRKMQFEFDFVLTLVSSLESWEDWTVDTRSRILQSSFCLSDLACFNGLWAWISKERSRVGFNRWSAVMF